MKTIGVVSRTLLGIGPLLALIGGCAGLPLPDAPTKDIAETRRLRADEATKHFETRRDFAQLQDAAARWKRGDAQGCEEELGLLLARNPKHREARLFLADVCMADGRQQQALEHVQSVLAEDPQNAHANRTMGLLRDEAGDTVEAAAFYRQAAESEPNNERYLTSYQSTSESAADSGVVGLADASDRIGNAGSSAPTAGTSEKSPANSDNPQIHVSAATEALRTNRPDRAVEILTTAKQQFPDSAAIHRILGVAHYRRGDYESSQVALQQALSLDNASAVAYFLLGCTQVKLGQLEAADANFRLARAIDPKYSMRQK